MTTEIVDGAKWTLHEEARWYVAYTYANHEKRAAEQMEQKGVEHFVPMYESLRQWKDRQKRVRLPLFPGYVFLRVAPRDRLQVLQLPSVVRFVGFGGQPHAVPEVEIAALRRCSIRELSLEPYPYFQAGTRVTIKAGPLQGLEGRIIRKKNRLRFVISLDLIKRSAAVDVGAADLEPAFWEGPRQLEALPAKP